MNLRQQILDSPEMLSDLDWAAERRFREGEDLFCLKRYSGAVYLLGLSAEMWLKLACFRLRGANPSQAVAGQLTPARLWMRQHAPAIGHEAYHSLLFWAEYLIRWRAIAGRNLPSRLAGDLQHHVANRLYADWRIDLRYRQLSVSESHAWRVYNDVEWIRNHWNNLWR